MGHRIYVFAEQYHVICASLTRLADGCVLFYARDLMFCGCQNLITAMQCVADVIYRGRVGRVKCDQ